MSVTFQQRSSALIYGDSDWLLNSAIDYYSNSALALNSFLWLLDRTWSLVPHSTQSQNESVAVTASEFQRLMLVTVLGIEFLALAGIAWCARREFLQ